MSVVEAAGAHTGETLPPSVAPEVIERARDGQADALAQIYRVYQPALLRYLRGMALTMADDVLSEVWVDVARGLGRFRGDGDDLRRWLFTIARRRMIDAFRLRSPVPDGEALDRGADLAPGPEDVATGGGRWVESVLARLPPSQAEVILLRVLAGFDVGEVAAMTDRTPAAVRVLAQRGLSTLRAALVAEGVTSTGSDPDFTDLGATPSDPITMNEPR